jgi:hypothetical protein
MKEKEKKEKKKKNLFGQVLNRLVRLHLKKINNNNRSVLR